MFVEWLCSPALVYVAFSFTHILIDMFRQNYNTAMVKFVLMIVFALMINILCDRGLRIVAWFLVFIPFIVMTFTTTVMILMFGDALHSRVTRSPDASVDYQVYHDPMRPRLGA